jgi:phosphoribosyl 1,2-cyclic phosphodiesterase
MVDCGFSLKDSIKRLERLGKTPEDISAILVTHEHSDHWKGVLPLATKYGIKVFMTAGCFKATKANLSDYQVIQLIDSHICFNVGEIEVKPVPVPHDAREPVQYILSNGHHKLGILTDIGSITPYVSAVYNNCDALIVEANHDLNMLRNGDYPSFLKERVGSQWGHLNNEQTASLINSLTQDRLQHLVIAHISLRNNDIKLVKSQIEPIFKGKGSIHYACQNQGFGWLNLD